jgi:hypothetical protein
MDKPPSGAAVERNLEASSVPEADQGVILSGLGNSEGRSTASDLEGFIAALDDYA